jgi:hypothetical protein
VRLGPSPSNPEPAATGTGASRSSSSRSPARIRSRCAQWGDNIDKFGITEGETITAHIDLQSREYNGRLYTESDVPNTTSTSRTPTQGAVGTCHGKQNGSSKRELTSWFPYMLIRYGNHDATGLP